MTRNRPTGIIKKKEEVKEEPKDTVSINLGEIGLNDLAELVKKYGVGVTLTVSQKGTEVRVHN